MNGVMCVNKMKEGNIEELRTYKSLHNEEFRNKAIVISGKMLKAAGKITPRELGAASALCLEMALLLLNNDD